MIDQFKKWLRAWKSGRREVSVREHVRSFPGEKQREAREGIKPLILEATQEFLIPTEVGKALVTIADKRIAEALQKLRLEQETEGKTSRLQMEEICRRLTEVEGTVEGLRTATAAGAGHIEELNHRLATHEASAAGALEGINTRLAGLREEIAKEIADRHGAISHLHAALTEKISATHVEQMFQKLQTESAAKDRDALLKEEVNDRRLLEVEAGIADIRAEVARDAERIGELRQDVDAKLQALRARLGRNRELRIPAFTMRSEEGDDGVMTLEPVVPHASQAGASD